MSKELAPKIEKPEKKDYITRYKDLEIKEVGKGGERIINTGYVERECSVEEVKYKGIDVEDIVISTKTKEGEIKRVDLKKYLHPNFRFAFTDNGGFEVSWEYNTLIYPSIGKKGDQLILLHEIKHTHQKAEIEGISLGSLEGKIERGENLSEEEVEKVKFLFEDAAHDEREAWAWAIRTLRRLRKEGINLEPEIKNFDEVESLIKKSLASYDRTHSGLIKKVFRKPIFWKEKEWVKDFKKGELWQKKWV